MSFEKFGLAEPIMRAVVLAGYTTPTPIQAEAIPRLLAGRDLMGCAQTGTGKTAAFALPILHRLLHSESIPRGRPVRVLVLSPTRELAAQIGASFCTYGRHTAVRSTVVYGGVGQVPQVRALRSGVDVLVATPGRLIDLVNQRHANLRSVETFVVDEADRMLDMGFLPDLRRVIALLPQQRQTVLFSATMPGPIEHLARTILRDAVHIKIAPVRSTTELIEESVCFVSKDEKPELLARLLTSQPVARALVFTRTKHGADRVARQLNRRGIRAEAMHGDKSQSARQRSLNLFKSDAPPVLVATDVAARGIDVGGISHVFNYDLPHDPETYVHRIGRTGRAGCRGVAVSFCDAQERPILRAIERLIRRSVPVATRHSSGQAGGRQPQPAGWGGERSAKRKHRYSDRPAVRA
jgi:ATP-dependent RNA helicase RhlE